MSNELKDVQCGVIRHLPEDAYHALDMCSASRLRTMHRLTPMHLRQELDGGGKDSGALRLGSALHAIVLEGIEAFEMRFAVGGPINPKTGAPFGRDTKTFAEWAAAQGRPCIPQDDYDSLGAMAASIWSHPAASALLARAKDRELTIINDLHGQRCKARIDAYSDSGVIVDIKTTARGAGKVDFERSLATMGYGLQASLYEALAASHGLKVGHFIFVVVETEAPYAVACYRVRNEVMLAYEQLLPKLIERYGECVASGVWPGWPEDVQEIGLPAWLRAEIDREINAVEVADE